MFPKLIVCVNPLECDEIGALLVSLKVSGYTFKERERGGIQQVNFYVSSIYAIRKGSIYSGNVSYQNSFRKEIDFESKGEENNSLKLNWSNEETNQKNDSIL